MSKLIDFLTFKETAADRDRRPNPLDAQPRQAERDADLLNGKYPPDSADIESLSQYRLASLMQYPHY